MTFNNRERAKQLVDFEGLRFGNRLATDIDAFIEYDDRTYVFIEAKHTNKDVPFGQRLALERVVDALSESPNRCAIAIVAEHETDGDIDIGACPVREYRVRCVWRVPERPITVREAVQKFTEWSNR